MIQVMPNLQNLQKKKKNTVTVNGSHFNRAVLAVAQALPIEITKLPKIPVWLNLCSALSYIFTESCPKQ